MSGQDYNHDHELRDLLGQVGRAAEQRAPSFQRTWSAARHSWESGPMLSWRPRLAWAFAAVLVLGAVGAGFLWQRPTPNDEKVARTEPATSALTEALGNGATGRQPTDFLLSPDDDTPPQSIAQLANEITDLLRP